MTSDCELDALIAEKVMGWTYWRSKHGYWNIVDAEKVTHTPLFGVDIPEYDAKTGEKLAPPPWYEGWISPPTPKRGRVPGW